MLAAHAFRLTTPVASVCLSCALCVAARSVHAQRCEYGTWTPLAAMPAGRDGTVARFPSVADVGDRVYVVGDNLPWFTQPPRTEARLAAWELEGASIGAPAGGRLFAFPQIAPLNDSGLMMLWGEPDSASEDIDPLTQRISQVWWARYDTTAGWSSASRLIRETETVWADGQRTSPVRGSDGALHHAVPTPHGLRYLHWDGGAWTATTVPRIRSASYASLALANGGRAIVIAYVSAVEHATADVNSVFVVRSADRGVSWSLPLLVSRSGETPALEVQLLADPGGVLHLVWVQDTTGDFAPEILRHVSSRDDGRTWSRPDDTYPPEGFRKLHTAMDSCGALHAIYMHWFDGGRRGHTDYLRFANGRWSDIEHLFSGGVWLDHAMRARGNELVLVSLFADDSAGRDLRSISSRFSRLAIRARPSPSRQGGSKRTDW